MKDKCFTLCSVHLKRFMYIQVGQYLCMWIWRREACAVWQYEKKNDSVHGQKQQPSACGRVSFVAIMAWFRTALCECLKFWILVKFNQPVHSLKTIPKSWCMIVGTFGLKDTNCQVNSADPVICKCSSCGKGGEEWLAGSTANSNTC